jgi:hypothetical protein
MMNEASLFIGQLCHIEAAEPGGERFNPEMTNEQRRAAPNLMLMCYPHHVETNNVGRFSVLDLRKMKANHERRFARPDRALREKIKNLSASALVGSGVIAGLSIAGIIQQIKSAFDALTRPSTTAKPMVLRKELEQGLRYAPTGTIYCFSHDELHVAVGNIILEIFEAAGWRIERLDKPIRVKGLTGLRLDKSMLMIFESKSQYELPITQQAVAEFFVKCGFTSRHEKEEAFREEGGQLLRLYVPVVVRSH